MTSSYYNEIMLVNTRSSNESLPDGTKSLPELLVICYQLDGPYGQNSVKLCEVYHDFHIREFIYKHGLGFGNSRKIATIHESSYSLTLGACLKAHGYRRNILHISKFQRVLQSSLDY